MKNRVIAGVLGLGLATGVLPWAHADAIEAEEHAAVLTAAEQVTPMLDHEAGEPPGTASAPESPDEAEIVGSN